MLCCSLPQPQRREGFQKNIFAHKVMRRVAGGCAAVVAKAVTPFRTLSGSSVISGRPGSLLLGRIVPFKLADIGEGILKVEVKEWSVKPGDTVQEFDKLCEVQSDKATVEITSRFAGVVKKLYIDTGGEARVGQPLVDIEVADGSTPERVADSKAPENTTSTASPLPVSTPNVSIGGDSAVLATPAVRHIARTQGVDLRQVAPTGRGGRVMKEDLLRFMEGGPSSPVSSTPSTQSPPAAASRTPAAAAADVDVPLKGLKKAMVVSMTKANAIPTFGACDEIEISLLLDVRDRLRPVLAKRSPSLKLSFMPFFLKAASQALKQYPSINAYTNDDCSVMTIKGSHNIGFALDTPNGLIVPNVKNVQQKSIFELAAELDDMIKRGVAGKLSLDDLQGGTFTLSNIGSIGATYASPVIFPPQVAIGAIGRSMKLPRFDDKGAVYAANIVNVSWSADHRVVDGATMVRFGNMFRELLESPDEMLLDLK